MKGSLRVPPNQENNAGWHWVTEELKFESRRDPGRRIEETVRSIDGKVLGIAAYKEGGRNHSNFAEIPEHGSWTGAKTPQA
jgi:hypothetical protein